MGDGARGGSQRTQVRPVGGTRAREQMKGASRREKKQGLPTFGYSGDRNSKVAGAARRGGQDHGLWSQTASAHIPASSAPLL